MAQVLIVAKQYVKKEVCNGDHIAHLCGGRDKKSDAGCEGKKGSAGKDARVR